jgi:formylglycine-generating enzyme required for sulfatase activity
MNLKGKSTKNPQARLSTKTPAIKKTVSSTSNKPEKFKDNTIVVKTSKRIERYLNRINPFRLARNLVTIEEWNSVRDWARKKGYRDLPELPIDKTSPLGPKEPVENISVRELAKWCNAKSEMVGLKPCYHIKGKIFKSGKPKFLLPTKDNMMEWNTNANGYRLATEAEWLQAIEGYEKNSNTNAKASTKINNEIVSFPTNEIGISDIERLYEWIWELLVIPHKLTEYSKLIGFCKGWQINDYNPGYRKGFLISTHTIGKHVGFRVARNIN